MSRWVYKPDGAVQCAGNKPTSVDDARAELAKFVGDQHIEEACAGALATISLCGAPSGGYNACKLTDEGYTLLMRGTVGPSGWRAWPYKRTPCQPREAATMASLSARVEPGVPFPLSREDRELTILESSDDDELRPSRIAAAVGRLTDVTAIPTGIAQLLGWELRVLEPGQPMTLDWRSRRIVVSVDEHAIITAINFH